jgi:hypothetical protein
MSNEIPVYDASSGCYCAGVTNLNLHNVYSALRSISVVERKGIQILVNVMVYDNLSINNLIEYHSDGKMTWCLFTIDIDPQSVTTSPVVNSLITSPCGKQVVLRTREY